MLNKIKFGIIGFGFMGKTHYTNLNKNPDTDVTAIFSIPLENIETEPNVEKYDDWKKLIDEADVDALVIATPTNTHTEIAEYAANKKKHIFLEKPMARTIAQCEKIIEVAEKNKVKLFIGHVLRFWPSYSSVKCHLDLNPKAIGNIKMMRLLRLGAFPAWSKWFADKTKSGGVVLDLSIHDIDYVYWSFGKLPLSVYCDVKDIKIDDYVIPGISATTLNFGDGIGYCEASWAGKANFPFTVNAEIIGQDGIVKFDGASTVPVSAHSDETTENIDPYENDGYYLEMESFVSSIMNDTKSAIDGEQGKNAVAICLAAIKSSEEQRPVKMEEIL